MSFIELIPDRLPGSSPRLDEPNISREEIAQQVSEFLRQGGRIHVIEPDQTSVLTGEVMENMKYRPISVSRKHQLQKKSLQDLNIIRRGKRSETGVPGITRAKGRWTARYSGRYIGMFATPEEAVEAQNEFIINWTLEHSDEL